MAQSDALGTIKKLAAAENNFVNQNYAFYFYIEPVAKQTDEFAALVFFIEKLLITNVLQGGKKVLGQHQTLMHIFFRVTDTKNLCTSDESPTY